MKRRGLDARSPAWAAALAVAITLSISPAKSAPVPGLPNVIGPGWSAAEPGQLCRAAIQQADAGSGLPPHLLAGIAHVESGRRDPSTGRFHPWPWTINAEGRGSFFDSKAEAVAYVRGLQARGVASFDVGCMQINLLSHPNAFRDLDEAFDPIANARYAVKFLTELRDKTGDWDTASAWYHSADPARGVPYRGLVATAMLEESKLAPADAAPREPARGLGLGMVAALQSMPSRGGTRIMLAGSIGGGASGQAGMSAAPGGPASSVPSSAMVGRGLDAYRLRPVAMVAMRVLPPR